MLGSYPLSFADWRKLRDMGAVGAVPPIGTGFGFDTPSADQELMVKSGLGGGMRDSNIQDTTGFAGGGMPVIGGSGGGMRDSNIADATGTTGGNATANDKPFDWGGLADGFSLLGKGMKGANSQSEMRVPQLTDDSAQRMSAASQLMQAVMNKRKPKGLI